MADSGHSDCLGAERLETFAGFYSKENLYLALSNSILLFKFDTHRVRFSPGELYDQAEKITGKRKLIQFGQFLPVFYTSLYYAQKSARKSLKEMFDILKETQDEDEIKV